MFSIKNNEEIGANLKTLILNKYNSVRSFCKEYLRINGSNLMDSAEIRNLCNRFSQILNGSKSLQTYDLPIVSELLGVSCEDILSCGETRVPLNFRRTNYNIAFSDNKADWEEYLSREDCIAAYADEFGKTVVDYAIEFKNYDFIKYLVNHDYITLVVDDPRWNAFPNFGAESKIKERPYEHATMKEELYNNKLLRSQIISLAIEKNDLDALDTFKARILPPQLYLNIYNPQLDLSQYYDETLINTIASSDSKAFDYFLQEYEAKDVTGTHTITWIYPFIGQLIEKIIKTNKRSRALKALNIAIQHNKKALEALKKSFTEAAKTIKEDGYARHDEDALEMVKRDFHINQVKSFVCLNVYFVRTIQPACFNIIDVNCSSSDQEIQSLIDELKQTYNRILDIPNQIINISKGGE